MYTEGFEQWFRLNKNFAGPFSEWSRTATEICRRTMEQNLELISENCSRLSEQLKRLSDVKRPEEFINLQKEYMNENLAAAVDNFQKIVHNSMENVEEFTKAFGSLREPIIQATHKATEKAKRYAEKATEDISK